MEGTKGQTPPSAENHVVSKTVADIWQEVQIEQRRFNEIVKVLVILLIVAAVVAGALAVVSYLRFSDIRDNYDRMIEEAELQGRISDGDGMRQRQRMINELLEIREDSEAQRAEASLTRQVDQALAATRTASGIQSIGQLKRQALEAARDHLLGHRLNLATSYLVSSVMETSAITLNTEERAMLSAALTSWRTPKDGDELMQALIDASSDPIAKGYGHTGLAQIYYARTADVDNLGATTSCAGVIQEVNTASGLGVEGMAPYLWKGECLRDQGNEREAFRAFADAMRAGDVSTESLNNLRLSAHGAGTTLIARAARAPGGKLSDTEVEEVFSALAPITETVPGLEGASDTRDPLAAAFALLNYAGDMRVKRGEGEVGKIYTAENVGFVYVLSGRWMDGLKHAQAIDKVIPMAWNLTVLYICADELSKQPGVSRTDRDKYRTEAERAQNTLALMEHRRFGENELKKLLPVKYDDVVDELVRPARKAMEEAQANAISFTPVED